MNTFRRVMGLFMLFAALQYYFLVYEGIIQTGDGTLSRFVVANYDQIQYYFFFLALFLFLFIFVIKIPVLMPEYRIRFGTNLTSFVVFRSLWQGAGVASVFYGIIVAMGTGTGLLIDNIPYLLTAYARLILYFISCLFVYWGLYFTIGRELIAMAGLLLSQWLFAIFYTMIDFYFLRVFQLNHSIKMRFFSVFVILMGVVGIILIRHNQSKEYLL